MQGLYLFILILSEIGIGLSAGLILNIIFSGSSEVVSTAGLSMSNMIDPQSEVKHLY